MDADFFTPWSLLSPPDFCPYYFSGNSPEYVTSPLYIVPRVSLFSYYRTSPTGGLASSIPTLKTPFTWMQSIPLHLFSLLHFLPFCLCWILALNYRHWRYYVIFYRDTERKTFSSQKVHWWIKGRIPSKCDDELINLLGLQEGVWGTMCRSTVETLLKRAWMSPKQLYQRMISPQHGYHQTPILTWSWTSPAL